MRLLALAAPVFLAPPVCLAALVCLASLVCLATPARAEAVDPVETELNACLDRPENQSTAGMTGCMTTAAAAYEQGLDVMFRQVVSKLDADSRELVRTAQRQWEVFRHAEEGAENGPWRGGGGAIARVALLSASLNTVKQRIEQLRVFLPDSR